MIPFEEFARRVCLMNHPFSETQAPCGVHTQQARAMYVLTLDAGTETLGAVLQTRLENGIRIPAKLAVTRQETDIVSVRIAE